MTRRHHRSAKRSPIGCLQLFAEKAEQLRTLRLAQSGMPWSFKVGYDQKRGLYHSEQGPDEEELRSYLTLFRQFVSESEPVFVNRVFSLCDLYLTEERLRQELRNARARWSDAMRQGLDGWQAVVDGEVLTPEYAFDLWLNGHYFHSDPDKAAKLEKLASTDDLHWLRMRFLTSLRALTAIVLQLGDAVREALDNGLFSVPPE